MSKKTRDLNKRITALLQLDLKLVQIARASGVSYTALHRFIHSKDLKLSPETCTMAHANLDKWIKGLGAA